MENSGFPYAGPYSLIQRNVPLYGGYPYGSPCMPVYGLLRELFLEFYRRFAYNDVRIGRNVSFSKYLLRSKESAAARSDGCSRGCFE
jgi:hypothetical protein